MLSKPDYLEGGGGEFHLAGARVDVHLLEMGVNVIHVEQSEAEEVFLISPCHVPRLLLRRELFLATSS